MNRKHERFINLAEKRVTRVLRDLRLIGNLANRGNYSYTDEDIRKIFQAIDVEMKNIKRRFEDSSDDPEVIFKLR